jgi:hypothetical protein
LRRITGQKLSTVKLLSLLTFSGCATTEKALRERGLSPLIESKLEALYSGGAKACGTTPEGVTSTVVYASDGKARLEIPGKSFDGSWRIENSKLCTQYSGLRDSLYICFPIYKVGENQYQNFNPDGSLVSTFSFID